MRQVDGVVSVNDVLTGEGTLALVSMRYIREESGCVDTPNVIIYPGYHHNFSERELFLTAQRRNRFAYCAQAVVEHLHWLNGKVPTDDVYVLGQSTWDLDMAMHLSRLRLWEALPPPPTRDIIINDGWRHG